MDALSISEAQQQVDQWIKTYGVRYFNELTNMAILTEEVGENGRCTMGITLFGKPNRRRSYGCLPQKS